VNLKQVALIRQPRERVWQLMRDRLTEFAPGLDDIDAVENETRVEDAAGVCTVVNVWRARRDLAGLFPLSLPDQTISWTDHAQWYSERFETRWEVRPHFLTDRLRCSGLTQYLPAMGGQGTRVVLEVTAELHPDPVTGKPVDPDGLLVKAVQSVALTLVCKNFRRLLEMADECLRRENR
jgi:hypothetical protein